MNLWLRGFTAEWRGDSEGCDEVRAGRKHHVRREREAPSVGPDPENYHVFMILDRKVTAHDDQKKLLHMIIEVTKPDHQVIVKHSWIDFH